MVLQGLTTLKLLERDVDESVKAEVARRLAEQRGVWGELKREVKVVVPAAVGLSVFVGTIFWNMSHLDGCGPDSMGGGGALFNGVVCGGLVLLGEVVSEVARLARAEFALLKDADRKEGWTEV